MSARQILGAGFLGTVAVVVPLVIVGTIVSHDVEAPRPDHTQWAGLDYEGDPTTEPALVEIEERHLADVRSTRGEALWQGGGPYHLSTDTTAAFVLVPRAEPYTLDELVSIAPQTIAVQADGAYLVSESVVVLSGATLDMSGENGTVVLLTSTPTSFVSISTLGGSLIVHGSEAKPLRVSSWDPNAAAADQSTGDGRAYIRVVGGQADFAFAEFRSLGFWSGATGGVALTGSEVPGSAELASAASPMAPQPAPSSAPGSTPTPQPTQTEQPPPVAPQPPSGPNPPDPVDPAAPTTAEQPSTEVRSLELEPDYSANVPASATIQSVLFSDNAYGLFVESAENVVIADSTIENSRVDGLLFFRDVVASTVTDTVSRNNAADGFSLARSTTGTQLEGVTATGNGRNGISVEGGPLVAGPNPTGDSPAEYGRNSVLQSTASSNGRYGIEVVGGTGLVVEGNTVSGGSAGIVVAEGADTVTIAKNTVSNTESQGIALRDAGQHLIIDGNTVSGADVGIYARNAGGEFRNNTVSESSIHAISLVGSTGFSTIIGNTVSGTGPSAIDVVRTNNASVSGNNAEAWEGTKPVDVTVRSIFQPLTVLWLVLGTLVFVTAFLGFGRRRRQRQLQDRRAPLSAYTRGVVSVEEARALAAAGGRGAPVGSHS